jgi:serine/threonine protein kinase
VAIHPGDDLAGYRVTRLLGRGGMGEVWAATDDRTGGEVAIKVLLARAAMKPDLVRRFEREAKIAGSIQSPYVCRLLDVATGRDGSALLVFEHLTGESLADRLKREQYLPLSEVGPIIDDVLQGLAAAHAAGVIHRDLKPGNIFLEHLGEPDREERGKILDFGISKISGKRKEEPTLTAFDATLGSFAYMAPEQVRGAARADERADIYAVGAVAFRALSGRLPFEGTTAAVLVSLKLDRNPPRLEEATGEKWPGGVERFLERALARVRENRFSGALEALEAWRAIQPNHLTRHIPPPRTSSGSFNPMPAPMSSRSPSIPPIQDDATEVDNPPTMTVDGTWSGREIDSAHFIESREPPPAPPAARPGPPPRAPVSQRLPNPRPSTPAPQRPPLPSAAPQRPPAQPPVQQQVPRQAPQQPPYHAPPQGQQQRPMPPRIPPAPRIPAPARPPELPRSARPNTPPPRSGTPESRDPEPTSRRRTTGRTTGGR